MRELGIPTVDEWPSLRQRALVEDDIFMNLYVMRDANRIFGHMSSKGIKFIAELLANVIR